MTTTRSAIRFLAPAVVIAHAGASESLRKAAANTMGAKTEAGRRVSGRARRPQGVRQVLPHIEYQQRMTLNLGERTFDLIYLKNVHSEADTRSGFPRSACSGDPAVGVKRYPNIRPSVTIPDTLAAIKLMRALNRAGRDRGHGARNDADLRRHGALLRLLLERVGGCRARANRSIRSRPSSRCPNSTIGPARSASPATSTQRGARERQLAIFPASRARPVVREVEVAFGLLASFPLLDLGAQREKIAKAFPFEARVRREAATGSASAW